MVSNFPIPTILRNGEFSNESAYFLGAFLSGDETHKINSQEKVWLAMVRHNPRQCSIGQLEEHQAIFAEMCAHTSGSIYSKHQLSSRGWIQSNKEGFAAVFISHAEMTIDRLAAYAKEMLPSLSHEQKGIILLGAFDGRASIDVDKSRNTIRYISLDCSSNEAMSVLCKILDEYHMSYNCNYARERLEGGDPRKPQLRIASRSAQLYAAQIGFLSPQRIQVLKSVLPGVEIQCGDAIQGQKILKTVGGFYPRTAQTPNIRPTQKKQEAEIPRQTITVPIEKTAIPKTVTKPQLVSVKVGEKIKHKAFGIGTVYAVEGTYIRIRFETVGEKSFVNPDAFTNGFLKKE